jgi:thiamine phosphate synthase YjbQ (UPF0047 family)
MKSHTHYLKLFLPTERGFRNITHEVEDAIRTSGVQEGIVLVNITCEACTS